MRVKHFGELAALARALQTAGVAHAQQTACLAHAQQTAGLAHAQEAAGVAHAQQTAGVAHALQTASRGDEAPAAYERQSAPAQTQERNLFAASIGPVLPLRRPASTPPARARPGAVARQRMLDEARALRESLSDDFDVTSLLETDAELSFLRPGVGGDVLRKLRRGVWVTQSQLDLHGLRREAAREKLLAFLRDAGRSGQRCVRIIHGKGNGSPGRESVLKSKVKGWLVQRNDVLAFVQARAADGGHGALLVLLRPGAPG